MTEKLLQFIWQHQYFNKQQLQTVNGDDLQIISQGNFNTNQGPDFLNASIKINNIILAGNIEVHINSSDWILHKHSNDEHYKNIILHVVWKNDTEVLDRNNNIIPTLELQSLVPKVLLTKYEGLMNTNNKIACECYLPALSSIGWIAWKERLATERLEVKCKFILTIFQGTNNNWEETFWQVLAYNFGLKQNAELFLQMAKSVSVNILAKHKNHVNQLEALLLGQSNLLKQNSSNEYEAMLYKEFIFLQKKYALKQIQIQPVFLRMRPANFPTLRLAQLAMLVHQSNHLFSKIKEIENVNDLKKLLQVTASGFWNNYYLFDNKTEVNEPKKLGKQMVDNILINTILPVLFAYGLYMDEDVYKLKAVNFLQSIDAEKNSITNSWQQSGVENKSAFDSQALIHLFNNYCAKKMCLKCAVGNKVMSR